MKVKVKMKAKMNRVVKGLKLNIALKLMLRCGVEITIVLNFLKN